MTETVLKLEFYNDKIKKKVLQKVSGLSGVESIAIDMKDKKLTVIGDIDPVKIVAKVRKICHTDIVSVGPAKEPEKKKDEPKKEDDKKDEPKKGGGEKKQGGGGGDNKKNDSKGEAAKAYPGLPPPAAYPGLPPPAAYQQHYPPPLPYQHSPLPAACAGILC